METLIYLLEKAMGSHVESPIIITKQFFNFSAFYLNKPIKYRLSCFHTIRRLVVRRRLSCVYTKLNMSCPVNNCILHWELHIITQWWTTELYMQVAVVKKETVEIVRKISRTADL